MVEKEESELVEKAWIASVAIQEGEESSKGGIRVRQSRVFSCWERGRWQRVFTGEGFFSQEL